MAVSPEFLALQERVAGRYSIEEEHSHGPATIRFRAREVVLERPVVIELLRPGRASLRDRFLEGARLAAGLFHPGIAPVHAVQTEGPLVFLVRAHVEGETLAEQVERRGPLRPPAARRLVEEVAWALAHAHGRGVAHGHLTPDEIVLEAGSGRAVLTGFGLAAVLEPSSGSRSRGTAGDLHALGACAAFALTGILPSGRGAHGTALLGADAPGDPPLPPELAAPIERCLDPDPSRRPASASELAAAVAQPGAMPSILPSSARRLLRRIRQFSPVAGIGTFVLYLMRESDLELIVTPVVVAILGWMAVGLVRSARQVLRDGFDQDLITWILEEEAQELATHPDGSPHRIQNMAIGCGGWMFMIMSPLFVIFGIGALTSILTGGGVGGLAFLADTSVAGMLVVTFLFLAGPSEPAESPRRWLDFGERMMVGRFGSLLFRVARLGLGWGKRGDRPVAGEPTVLALSASVDELFDSLPPDVRRRFAEAPEAIRRLAAHVREIQEQEAALAEDEQAALAAQGEAAPAAESESAQSEGALAARGEPAPADGGGSADSALAAQIRAARARLAARRAEATAALEHLRLALVRMGAGDASDPELTGDLTLELERAHSIGRDLGALLDANAELRELLAERPADDPHD